MTEHTPGPWQDAGGWFVTAPERQLVVAEVYAVGRPDEEVDANTRLIAAAPDLLAACELALATFRRDRMEEIDDREPEIDALRAAVAQARGDE